MPIALAILFTLGLILAANWVARSQEATWQRLFSWGLLLVNLPLFFTGLVMLLIPAQAYQALLAFAPGFEVRTAGTWLVLMAIWGSAMILPGVRRALARLLPLDPASPVHTTALVLAGYVAGNTLSTVAQGGLAGIADNISQASLSLVLGQEALFALVGMLGVGFLVRRHGADLWRRLGLAWPTGRQLGLALGVIAFLVLLQSLVGALWLAFFPDDAQVLDNINTIFLGNFDSAGEWFLLALAAGIGEEILFRGALQPVFGLVGTSALFAIAHIQYSLSPLTLFIFLLALVLGVVRQRSSTTVAIFVHFGYNFVLGLASLLLGV